MVLAYDTAKDHSATAERRFHLVVTAQKFLERSLWRFQRCDIQYPMVPLLASVRVTPPLKNRGSSVRCLQLDRANPALCDKHGR